MNRPGARFTGLAVLTLVTALAAPHARAQTATLPAASAAALAAMAQQRFGPLSAAESRLVRNAPYRSLAWSGPSSDPDSPSNDPARAQAWGAERTIRAAVIAWLLTDPAAVKLVHPSGVGVAGARITGQLDLSFLTAAVPLTLIDSAMPDGLDFSDARLAGLVLRRSRVGPLTGDRASVHGDLALTYGDYAEVSLFRTTIDGNLDCTGSTLTGDNPLSAIEANIQGDGLFHEDFTTGGVVDFRLARIGQSLSFHDAHFTGTGRSGLDAERATIGGTLYWVNIRHTPTTIVDLNDTRSGSLWDDAASWPAAGNLNLSGFVYSSFDGGPLDADARLAWLRRQPAALQAEPQPYRQLAEVLRNEGAEQGAVEVAIARENAAVASGRLEWAARWWKFALRVTIGYGYRPLRALWWIMLFVVLGTALFSWGYRVRLIAPTDAGAYEAFVQTGAPPPHYPPFNGFVYSLENFLPVVDLHQGTFWRPNPRHTRALGTPVVKQPSAPPTWSATLLRWYLWLHILAGWTITPLLFAGLAGLLRSD